MRKIKLPTKKIIITLAKKLNIKMSAYIWGLNPSENLLNKSEKKYWDDYISKNPSEIITYIDLEKRYFNYIEQNNKNNISEIEREYGKNIKNLSKEVLSQKVSYLKDVFKFEKDRQDRIDNKLMQIISQSSILTAVITLLLTLISDKMNFSLKHIVFLIILGLILLYFVWNIAKSLYMAIRILSPVGYRKPPYTSVLIISDNVSHDFLVDEFINLYNSIENNVNINSMKADKVEIIYKLFRTSLIVFLIFSLSVSVYIKLYPKQVDYNININNQINLDELEQDLKSINKTLEDSKSIFQQSSIKSEVNDINNKLMLLNNKISIEYRTEYEKLKEELLILKENIEKIDQVNK